MTQDQWQILAFKVALIAGFCSLAGWIVLYSLLADWLHNPIGRTLVAKTALIAALFIPTSLSLFFSLNRLDSRLVGWIDFGLIALVTPVMCWRCLVWVKLSRAGQLDGNDKNGNGGG
jgi:hypothetical protein